MNRRTFLSNFAPVFPKPALLQSGLEPYDEAWNNQTAAHLLRRTTFGIRANEIEQIAAMGLEAAVAQLLTAPAGNGQPINYYAGGDGFVSLGNSWVPPAIVNEFYEFGRTNSNKLWLINRMLTRNLTVFDKMALFWHNHFVVESAAVGSSAMIYKYFAAIDQYTFGNFKTLTLAISRTPAMLRYLNGEYNSAAAPDENYARELQELFTIGKGPDAQFTEEDVQTAARVLTGFRINPLDHTQWFFNGFEHDAGDKQFSGFYGNTIINGQSGEYGQYELNNMLDMIFAVPEVARFICRKIYRYFVYYQITPDIETNIIEPLADIFRNNDYEILPVLDALFKSSHFYDSMNFACYIKSPLDYILGICRNFDIPFWTGSSNNIFYQNWQVANANRYKCCDVLHDRATQTAMEIGQHPSVSGWPAFYQEPMFNEVWINSDTYSKRMEFAHQLCQNGINTGYLQFSNPSNFTLKINLTGFALSLSQPEDPNLLVSQTIERLYSYPVDEEFTAYLKSFLLSGTGEDYYWTSAWNNFVAFPDNITYKTIVETRLRNMIEYMLTQPEYQLL